MNATTWKSASKSGKLILILTYPFAILIHFDEWMKARRLKRNIRSWIAKAVANPKSVEAEFVAKWSAELRDVYGK